MNTPYGSIPEVFSPLSDKQIARMSGTAMSRREAVQRTLLGAVGLVLGHHLSLRALAAAPSAKAKAKSVIQIWMWGGPSHLDTWDPKPEAGNDYCGPLNKPIPTNLDGVRICELMPLLAKLADKYAIIRSMTHGNNGHETASYMVQTARAQGGREVFPSVGAVVSSSSWRTTPKTAPITSMPIDPPPWSSANTRPTRRKRWSIIASTRPSASFTPWRSE